MYGDGEMGENGAGPPPTPGRPKCGGAIGMRPKGRIDAGTRGRTSVDSIAAFVVMLLALEPTPPELGLLLNVGL